MMLIILVLGILMLVGGVFLIPILGVALEQSLAKSAEAKKEKIRLKHELDMEKLRLEYEREQLYAGALGRAVSDDFQGSFNLLEEEEKVQTKNETMHDSERIK